MGLINAVGNLGGFVGPYVGGCLQDLTHGSFLAHIGLPGGCLLAAGLVMLTLRRGGDRPLEAAQLPEGQSGTDERRNIHEEEFLRPWPALTMQKNLREGKTINKAPTAIVQWLCWTIAVRQRWRRPGPRRGRLHGGPLHRAGGTSRCPSACCGSCARPLPAAGFVLAAAAVRAGGSNNEPPQEPSSAAARSKSVPEPPSGPAWAGRIGAGFCLKRSAMSLGHCQPAHPLQVRSPGLTWLTPASCRRRRPACQELPELEDGIGSAQQASCHQVDRRSCRALQKQPQGASGTGLVD